MERNSENEKIKKSDFWKNKKVFNTDDIDANIILVSKKEPYAQKIQSNTLLDTMIMMALDRYAYCPHKWLAMLGSLKVIQQCPLRLAINNC